MTLLRLFNSGWIGKLVILRNKQKGVTDLVLYQSGQHHVRGSLVIPHEYIRFMYQEYKLRV